MDAMAATLLEALSQPLNGEQMAIDINLKLKVMTQAQDWMLKRERLKPKEEEEGELTDDLRRMLKDPEEWIEQFDGDPKFMQALMVRGWLPPLPRRPKGGRPTAEEAKLRQTRTSRERAMEGIAADEDDGDLARMLRAAQQNPQNTEDDDNE